jgi:ubiquinone/menaquinone biosynthesis C-methylase UbiE
MNACPQRARPITARLYMRSSRARERRGAAASRRRLLDGLRGSVLEVGAGHGLSFAHYPSAVGEVVALEPEPTLRAAAQAAAERAETAVRVLAGNAEEVPLPAGSVDAVVASLVLCSVADQDAAIAEIARVLRPQGELRFYEHVVSRRSALRRLQRAADATLWPRLSGGCRLGRDTVAALRRAGFAIERAEQSSGDGLHVPPKTFVLGTARLAPHGAG